ncbi:alpha/beta hydrolase family protein [Micromonospora sp. Llam0]|uniref:alpha/beta hydrolase n=1 Tax=Micromonospora sp. Llam0 TaxID=2485143 RepID=UPI000FA94E38|nr:alpha/beta hydrolase [Micromonospora sp. Llam0]ROO51819.1 alpha/beta hydrolase family protein [Micromonospora sp. Llam0]
MITYRQLWRADPAAWQRAAYGWRRRQPAVERRAAEVAGAAGALRAGWSGPAASAADTRLAGLGDRLDAVGPALCVVDQILSRYAEQLARAKAVLADWVATAGALGLSIDRDGRVGVDPAVTRPDGPTLAGARRVAAGVADALALATEADVDAARQLDAAATAASQGWPARPPATRPPPSALPATVRAWWAGLDDAQRRWLIRHEPARVGRWDGLPAAVRDQANRLLLGRQRAALLAERAALLDSTDPTAVPRLRRLDRLIAGLATVDDRLASPAGPRAYLLALDGGAGRAGDPSAPASTGRVILALGDPDQARRVLTHVPGMGSGLDRVGGELVRTEQVLRRCQQLAPQESTAAVLWLDYPAPAFVDEAASTAPARAGAADLRRFQDGLGVNRDGDPGGLTVLGHSYGSLVVGTAAQAPGLAADNLIFVGSPGVGVDRVDELAVPADRVWATTADNDVIRRATWPQLWPGDRLWHGEDPSGEDFGARVFTGDASGHLGYWAGDNPALDSMARIVLGADHPAGSRPGTGAAVTPR